MAQLYKVLFYSLPHLLFICSSLSLISSSFYSILLPLLFLPCFVFLSPLLLSPFPFLFFVCPSFHHIPFLFSTFSLSTLSLHLPPFLPAVSSLLCLLFIIRFFIHSSLPSYFFSFSSSSLSLLSATHGSHTTESQVF